MTTSLHINPEGNQGADPTPDIEGVTPDTEAVLEVLLIHILQEGIIPAGGPGHNPEPDLDRSRPRSHRRRLRSHSHTH